MKRMRGEAALPAADGFTPLETASGGAGACTASSEAEASVGVTGNAIDAGSVGTPSDC